MRGSIACGFSQVRVPLVPPSHPPPPPPLLLPSPPSSRLHREALKQSATDPKTGIIDVGILTTGVSSSERSRRQLLAKELLKLIQTRAKTGSQMKTSAMLELMQEQSQVVSSRVYIYRVYIYLLESCRCSV